MQMAMMGEGENTCPTGPVPEHCVWEAGPVVHDTMHNTVVRRNGVLCGLIPRSILSLGVKCQQN